MPLTAMRSLAGGQRTDGRPDGLTPGPARPKGAWVLLEMPGKTTRVADESYPATAACKGCQGTCQVGHKATGKARAHWYVVDEAA